MPIKLAVFKVRVPEATTNKPLRSHTARPTTMSGKAALKAINDAIRQQNFPDAAEKAKSLLAKDPKSYQGYLLSSGPHWDCT